MKRFYISLCLVAAIILSAIYLNHKIYIKSTELASMLENNLNITDIDVWWNNNKIWFDIIVSEELKNEVETNIYLLKYSDEEYIVEKLKISSQKIIESTRLSLNNIF